MAVTMLLLFGVFLWSSGSKKASRGPTTQQRLSKELPFQTWSGVERGTLRMEEEEEEVPPPPPLCIEASYLDELLFDPEADYEQVLAEARSYAVKQAEDETDVRRGYGIGDFDQTVDDGSKSKRNQRSRTARVYYVPPPVLESGGTDDYHHRRTKPKKSSSWKSLFFWRSSSSSNNRVTKWLNEEQSMKKNKKKSSNKSSKQETVNVRSVPRRTSVSGPLYTDGNGWAAKPWHSDWRKSKAQSGPLKLSAAISCTAQPDVAISPYVPLRCSTHYSTYSSGPLYVIT